MKKFYKNYPFIKNNFLDVMILFTKLIIVFFVSSFLIIIKFFCDFLIPKSSIIIPQVFHKLIIWLINIKIIKEGKITKHKKGILFVSNHLSYLDIPVLGSLLPSKFVAKDEVSSWPVFGYLAKIGNTIFIKRMRKNLFKDKDAIQKEIEDGFKVILFPEGTTSDGNSIKKFKSSLFECINSSDRLIKVQPISICYVRKNNLPMGMYSRRFIAWVGETSMVSSMKEFLSSGSITVSLIFHPEVSMSRFDNRKELTSFCEEQILIGLNKTIKI